LLTKRKNDIKGDEMKFDQIQVEEEAYESVRAVLVAARKCQELHERAGLILPQRVQWLLGIAPSPTGRPRTDARPAAQYLPAPERPSPPREAGPDWITIPARSATVTTVALAILRGAGGEPVRSRDVTEAVMNVLPNSTSGSVANAGTRLVADRTIERTDDGWRLLKPEKVAVLQGDLLWGAHDVFVKQEIAAHRREAILHILALFPKGLQIVQIVEQLRNCPWLRAPANKDLIKMDVQALLGENRLRRVGNTRKWQLAPQEKANE
jgi:hypothetical protein